MIRVEPVWLLSLLRMMVAAVAAGHSPVNAKLMADTGEPQPHVWVLAVHAELR